MLRRARDSDEELDEIREAASEEGGVRDVWRPQVRPMVAVGLVLAVALYALFGVLSLLFFLFKLPETKDRSLEEIEREVAGASSSP